MLFRMETSIMTKLSDTQCILLSTASQRSEGSIYPLPSTLKPGGGTTKAVDALVARGFAEERETSSSDAVRRADGDTRYGVFITSTGAEAIGVGETTGEVAASAIEVLAPVAKTPRRPPWSSACSCAGAARRCPS